MRVVLCLVLALASAALCAAEHEEPATELQIDVEYAPPHCKMVAAAGHRVWVHYTGKLTDGTEFDSSVKRNDPINFILGQGQVIKGWDEGLTGMCPGEKRKLKIPPHMAYGDSGFPPIIPGGATLIFETELIRIQDKSQTWEKAES